MTGSQLIEQLTKAARLDGLSFREIEKLVKRIFDTILIEALGTGGRIEIRGFGSFTTKCLSARTARNPKTGETVQVKERYTVRFKPGKGLLEKMNDATKA